MKQIAARVPEEVNAEIDAFSDENDITKSEAIRELLKRGLENDELQSENERLQRQLRETNKRVDEHQGLQRYVEDEMSYRETGLLTRIQWFIKGKD